MPQADEQAPSPRCDILFDTCCGIYECAACNRWFDTMEAAMCPERGFTDHEWRKTTDIEDVQWKKRD